MDAEGRLPRISHGPPQYVSAVHDSSAAWRDLDGEVRQRFELTEPRSIVGAVAWLARHDGYHGAKMPWTQPPQVKVEEPISIALDGFADLRSHDLIGIHIEQDPAGVANQPV